jgi:glycine/D-amino acid oxidase-like deaminating enzyme
VSSDICVLGAGIAGISATPEAARFGCKVIIVDALPALGGQAANSIIDTFCGSWEAFPDDRVHYLPSGSLAPAESLRRRVHDNIERTDQGP